MDHDLKRRALEIFLGKISRRTDRQADIRSHERAMGCAGGAAPPGGRLVSAAAMAKAAPGIFVTP
jgi:hypothetical protein